VLSFLHMSFRSAIALAIAQKFPPLQRAALALLHWKSFDCAHSRLPLSCGESTRRGNVSQSV
jgi:hypothetical protein